MSKHFHNKRVNKANNRKEFFNVSIDEIENAVKANFDKTVEFTRTAVAEEFYQSKSMASSII